MCRKLGAPLLGNGSGLYIVVVAGIGATPAEKLLDFLRNSIPLRLWRFVFILIIGLFKTFDIVRQLRVIVDLLM
jgi:hypothetical protein